MLYYIILYCIILACMPRSPGGAGGRSWPRGRAKRKNIALIIFNRIVVDIYCRSICIYIYIYIVVVNYTYTIVL